ncbi:hypothetical protein H0X09_02785 [Candidatus Saccharibacteria bacterium]|nr:hypothetical protein [Candidatus Saccharibacteria bacterium]
MVPEMTFKNDETPPTEEDFSPERDRIISYVMTPIGRYPVGLFTEILYLPEAFEEKE